MLQDLDYLALAAVSRGLPSDTLPDVAHAMRAAIVETLSPTWQPPPASDGSRARTPFHVLVRSAVRNAGLNAGERKPRWFHVTRVLAVGKTFAHELCAWAEIDPDELVGHY